MWKLGVEVGDGHFTSNSGTLVESIQETSNFLGKQTARDNTLPSDVTRGLSQGGQTLLKWPHWPPFANAIMSSLKNQIHYICVGFSLRLFKPHICGCMSSCTPGESHIQPHGNREVATKGTRITQK